MKINQKMYKNVEHISEEKIVGFIEGNLRSREESVIKNHINQCDDCFQLYANLHQSISEIERGKIPKVPRYFIKSLGYNKKQIFVDKIFNLIKNVFSIFSKSIDLIIRNLKPSPITFALVASAVVVLIITALFLVNNKSGLNKSLLQDAIKEKADVPAISTYDKFFQVYFKKDSIFIKQKFPINRFLTIESLTGEILLEKKFNGLTNQFSLKFPKKVDSIHVVVTTMDSIIYNKVWNYQ